MLAVGVTAVSTGAVFARLADAPPLAKAAWRCAVATAVLLPFAGTARLGALLSLPRKAWLAALAGALLALHFATWIASLDHTSVATSLLLVNTIPVWVVLFAPLVNGERASRSGLLGVGLALAGSAWLALGDGGSGAAERAGMLGPALALVGAVCAAGYMLVGRRIGAEVPLLGYLVVCYGTATLCLVAAALVTGTSLGGFAPMTMVWLLALGLVPQLVGHSACNAALRRLPALLVALPLLLEPVLGSLLAWWALDEPPPLRAIPAAALVLGGVALAAAGGPRRATPSEARPDDRRPVT